MQARTFTANVPKIVDLKLSSEQIFSRKLTLGAPDVLLRPPQAFKSGEWLFFSCSHFSATSPLNAWNRLVLFPVNAILRGIIIEIPLIEERMGTSCKRNDLWDLWVDTRLL